MNFDRQLCSAPHCYFSALFIAATLAICIASAHLAHAQQADTTFTNALTGDWWGARKNLVDAGVVFNATSTTDLSTVIGGGNQQGFIMPYLVDLNLFIDTEKCGAWQGGKFFVDFDQAGATQLGSRYVPDYWGWDANYPNTQNYTVLTQYWYQQTLFDGGLQLRLGKIDANYDFGQSYKGELFVNYAAYIPGTLALLIPSYPNQAGGAEIFFNPVDWFYANFAALSGTTNYYNTATGTISSPSADQGMANFLWSNPGSYFLMSEFGSKWKLGGHDGFCNVGLWQQTGHTATASNALQPLPAGQQYVSSPWGYYATLSQELWKPEGASDGQKLVSFGQFGWSPPDLNASQWSLQGGMTWQGILPNRPADSAGLLVAYTHFSNTPTLTASPGQGEMIVEGLYNIQLTPWLGIQPDVQYINQPSSVAGAGISDAWILTVRVAVSF